MKTYQWIPMDENVPKDGREILLATSTNVEKVFWGDINYNAGWGNTTKSLGWCISNSYGDEQGGYCEFDEIPEFYMEVPYP